jgi:hypothetical protein
VPLAGEGASLTAVMPGLDPGIHVFLYDNQGVDDRDKPGHDEVRIRSTLILRSAAGASRRMRPQLGLHGSRRPLRGFLV